jgi:hypothetical protein
MADENVAQPDAHSDLDFGKDAKRVQIALDAMYQADSLVRLLMSANDDYPEVIAGIGERMLQLSSIVMTALNDQMETTAEVAARLYGRSEVAHA